MKERVLKDDEVIKGTDLFHFEDYPTNPASVWSRFVGQIVAKAKFSTLWDSPLTKVTRPGGKKMKERQYPKVIYRMWGCATNDDLDMIDSLPPKERETAGEVAIYELKEVVTVTMEPKVRKKK